MNYRSLAGNVVAALISQGISLFASILTSLLVPKLLGVEEFGFWQLFIFYSSYVGFFHLGLCDGVYLINGGKARDAIDKRSINSQFIFMLIYQLLFAAIILLVAFKFFGEGERRFVVAATALFLFLNNANVYIGYIFQAMNETKLYSYSIMIDRGVFAFLLLILLVIRITRFEVYICAYAIGKTVSLAFGLYHFKDFLRSGYMPLKFTIEMATESIIVGSKLLVANLADMLILGIVRALIDANWGIEFFGKVSLALSLIGFFVTFMTQFSMVLYPALRQSNSDDIARIYHRLRSLLNTILPFVYLCYYPLSFLLVLWLPAYSQSMYYLGILLPVCVFNSAMSICSTTYLKVLRRERDILVLNLFSVFASAIAACVGVYLFNSIEVILISSVCVVGLRYFSSLEVLKTELGGGDGVNDLWLFLLSFVFVTTYVYMNGMMSFMVFGLIYMVFLLLNKEAVKRLFLTVSTIAKTEN